MTETVTAGPVVIIAPAVFDMAAAAAVRDQIIRAQGFGRDASPVILDMVEVTFISAVAVSVLVAAHKRGGAGRFIVARPGPEVLRALDAVRLLGVLDVRDADGDPVTSLLPAVTMVFEVTVVQRDEDRAVSEICLWADREALTLIGDLLDQEVDLGDGQDVWAMDMAAGTIIALLDACGRVPPDHPRYPLAKAMRKELAAACEVSLTDSNEEW